MGSVEPSRGEIRAGSSELFVMALDVMPDAAVMVDGAGEVVAVNRLAEELFGYVSLAP